jgi:hypothetical protein
LTWKNGKTFTKNIPFLLMNVYICEDNLLKFHTFSLGIFGMAEMTKLVPRVVCTQSCCAGVIAALPVANVQSKKTMLGNVRLVECGARTPE